LVTITFTAHDGRTYVVQADIGLSVMKAARNADVANIDAECGGACSCATCQIYVDPAWLDIVGLPSAAEDAMLDSAPQRRPNSRLSCQIQVTEALDGLKLSVPESQYR
jgi:2Fe-2S ferredoxin